MVVVDVDLADRQRHSVVDEPPAVSLMPYVVTTRTASFAVSRSAAEVAAPHEDPVERPQRTDPRRVVRQPGQLRGTSAVFAASVPAAIRSAAWANRPASKLMTRSSTRRGPRHDRPDQDLQPGDLVRRHRQQPPTGPPSASCCTSRRRRGSQR